MPQQNHGYHHHHHLHHHRATKIGELSSSNFALVFLFFFLCFFLKKSLQLGFMKASASVQDLSLHGVLQFIFPVGEEEEEEKEEGNEQFCLV